MSRELAAFNAMTSHYPYYSVVILGMTIEGGRDKVMAVLLSTKEQQPPLGSIIGRHIRFNL